MTFDSLLEENRHLKNYVGQLEEAVRLLRHRQFAPKSEKLDNLDDQIVFDEIEVESRNSENDPEDDEEQLDLIHVGGHTKKKPKRKKLPQDLPREIVTIDLPEDQRKCPHDQAEMKVIGHESSERIDVVPMQVKVIETRRMTYACPCSQMNMRTAEVPLDCSKRACDGRHTGFYRHDKVR